MTNAPEPLPPWQSRDPKEQEAFLLWAVDLLEKFEAPRAMPETPLSDDYLHYFFAVHIFSRLKVEEEPDLKWEDFCCERYGRVLKKPRQKRGPRPGYMQRVIAEYRALPLIFRHFYDRERRQKSFPPTRWDILKARHPDLDDRQWQLIKDEIKRHGLAKYR